MAEKKEAPDEESAKKTEVPSSLPEGFPSVPPHVHEKPYRYTVLLSNGGGAYEVTSDAKSVKELFDRIFGDPEAAGALPRTPHASGTFVHFPEATIKLSGDLLEGISADWEEDEVVMGGPLEEDDDDDEDDRPRRKKPKKPW